MENTWLLFAILLASLLVGFWLKAAQGRIKLAKSHQNFAQEFNAFGNLGKRATLIQFSTQYCAACPGSRNILTQISDKNQDINFIEIDAENNIKLARKLKILSTPTILITDTFGEELARITGIPNKKDIENYLTTINSTNYAKRSA